MGYINSLVENNLYGSPMWILDAWCNTLAFLRIAMEEWMEELSHLPNSPSITAAKVLSGK